MDFSTLPLVLGHLATDRHVITQYTLKQNKKEREKRKKEKKVGGGGGGGTPLLISINYTHVRFTKPKQNTDTVVFPEEQLAACQKRYTP